MCVGLSYCLVPLFVGLAFRKTLKKELDQESMSLRTFKICDSGIAQLLILVYLGMTIFPVVK